MTKITSGLGGKTEGEAQKPASDEHKKEAKAPEEENTNPDVTEINFEEVLASVGLDPYMPCATTPKRSIHWNYLRKLALSQIILSGVGLGCLVWAVVFTGMTPCRFMAGLGTLYFLTTGIIGHKCGKKKSYSHAVAYFVLVTFQTVFLISTGFALEFRDREGPRGEGQVDHPRHHHHHHNTRGLTDDHSQHAKTLILFLQCLEGVCVLGVGITGMCGWVACCMGLGRLLHAQDRAVRWFQKMESESKYETGSITTTEFVNLAFPHYPPVYTEEKETARENHDEHKEESKLSEQAERDRVWVETLEHNLASAGMV